MSPGIESNQVPRPGKMEPLTAAILFMLVLSVVQQRVVIIGDGAVLHWIPPGGECVTAHGCLYP